MTGRPTHEQLDTRDDLPEPVKELFVHLVRDLNRLQGELAGALELAYRRGMQAGEETVSSSDERPDSKKTCPKCKRIWIDGIDGCPHCGWGNPFLGIKCITHTAEHMVPEQKSGKEGK